MEAYRRQGKLSLAGMLRTGCRLPFIDGEPARTLVVLADKVRRQVRRALLLDFNWHASLVVHHILCLDSDDLQGADDCMTIQQ